MHTTCSYASVLFPLDSSLKKWMQTHFFPYRIRCEISSFLLATCLTVDELRPVGHDSVDGHGAGHASPSWFMIFPPAIAHLLIDCLPLKGSDGDNRSSHS